MERDFQKYPKYKEQYLRCMERMMERRLERRLESKMNWKTGQDIFDWWIGNDPNDPNQLSLLDEMEEE